MRTFYVVNGSTYNILHMSTPAVAVILEMLHMHSLTLQKVLPQRAHVRPANPAIHQPIVINTSLIDLGHPRQVVAG